MKTWFRDLALRLHIQKGTLATAFTVAGGFVLLIAVAPMPVGAVNPVVSILSSISFAIANFFGHLALWLMDSLIKVAQFNTFIDAPTVEKGWVIVRDVCNMFFIVVLLLMAFGTVFRIEEYQYKHALSKLLIMAVLVNFSKSICGLAIDFSQVVMLTFVNGFKDAAAGNFVNGFKIKEALQFAQDKASLDPNSSGADSQVLFYSSLLAMLSMFITMCVMFIYLGIFIMRIIVLWVLIILSPIAFTLQAFPGKMKEQAHEWWGYFGKYVTIGPVLAFGLWLSLAVMQMNPDPGKTFNVAVSGNVITGGPVVGLTTLGQSDVLLSFVINIAVMVIFLLIAGKSGTLGSGAATGFVNKMEHMGTAAAAAPLVAAGWMAMKGGRAGVKTAWQSATSRLGVEGSWQKWKTGWQAGSHKRAADRERRRQNIYSDRRKKGSILQALGSPEHLFEHQWNLQTLGKVATGRIGEVTGKSAAKKRAELDEAEGRKKQLQKSLQPNLGEQFRVRLNIDLGNAKAKKDELERMLASIATGSDVAILRKQAVSLQKGADGKEAQGDFLGARQTREKAEALEKQALDFENTKAARLTSVQTDLSQVTTTESDLTKQLNMTPVAFERQARKELTDQAKSKRLEATRLNSGGLTTEQQKARVEKTRILQEKRKKIEEERKIKWNVVGDELRAQGKSPAEIKQAQILADRVDSEAVRQISAELKDLTITDPKELVEKLIADAKRLDERAAAPVQTTAESDAIKTEIAELDTEIKQLSEEATRLAPATDFGLRRDLRSSIAESQKGMQTDNWQELLKILDDAVHVGDANKVSAALLQATKAGNENEILNSYGYDSDALGLQKFTKDILIKKLGMSEEQALSVASDVSYTGEGIDHWGVARAVVVKNGQMQWADEDQRQIETLAEVRKKDFETFSRRANRLAYGKEVVGDGVLPENASTEEKSRYFRQTGQRGFKLGTFGEAYIAENHPKYTKMMDAGRYNVNLAAKIGSGDNLENLVNKAKKLGLVEPENFQGFEQILGRIKNYGTGTSKEFEHIENMIKDQQS